ncbi:MAG: hypothetical protein EZS28_000622 [Streblomastix strix]|uniref:WD repeat protein n=1 Tax=Streblomastix strix TaxID=222440 RepID=A0A5J4X9I1_9EUKA|nr:MAG: hypothetical protein EZS28_000622 [Streblomastix strix]
MALKSEPIEDDDDDIGPQMAPVDQDKEDQEQKETELDEEESLLPIKCEFQLNSQEKTVTAIGYNENGTRLITGGMDGKICYYDFNGMDQEGQAFRIVQATEGHPITDLQISVSGRYILLTAEQQSPLLLNTEGVIEREFAKGDQYLDDLANTKGHTSFVRRCCWNPIVSNEFITCSDDGTARIWDSEIQFKHKHIIKVTSRQQRQGLRKRATTVCYSRDGTVIAAGTSDGEIQLWLNKSPFVIPTKIIAHSHGTQDDNNQEGNEYNYSQSIDSSVISLLFLNDYTIISRGNDNMLKVWDIRKIGAKKKTQQIEQQQQTQQQQQGLVFSCIAESYMGFGDICISSGGVYIVAGCGIDPKKQGRLIFIDTQIWRITDQYVCNTGAITRVRWNEKTNQICFGCTDGKAHILYSPNKSNNGAIKSASKAPRNQRKKNNYDEITTDVTIDNTTNRRDLKKQMKQLQRRHEMVDPKMRQVPEQEAVPGEGGKEGKLGGRTLKESIMLSLIKKDKFDLLHDDPRQQLLDVDEKAKAMVAEEEQKRNLKRRRLNEDEDEQN